MFNIVYANETDSKTQRIVKYGISEGVRGVESFKVETNTDPNSIKIKAGVYISDIFIVQMPNDYILSGFSTPTSNRVDYVYLDVTHDVDVDPSETPNTVIKFIEGASIPTAPEGHIYVPIWEIHRTANDSSITQSMIDDGGTPNSYDLRYIPPQATYHNHSLSEGAIDVTATANEINQALDGITSTVTSSKLSDLTSTSATGANLTELTDGSETNLHDHDKRNLSSTFNGDSGTAVPVNSEINFFGSGGANVTASGNTVTINSEDSFVKSPIEEDLNLLNYKVYGLPDDDGSFDDTTALNKKDIETKVSDAIADLVHHQVTDDINMNNNLLTGVKPLEPTSNPTDAVNKQSLEDYVNESLINKEVDLDKKYKLGGQDPININSVSGGHVDMNGYMMKGLHTPSYSRINDINDPNNHVSVNKLYVDQKDDNILQESKDYTDSQIGNHDLNSHPVGEDLNMAKSGSTHKIYGLTTPTDSEVDAAATVEYVKNYVNDGVSHIEGDNLGNHEATQDLNMTDHKIINLKDPGNPDDASNKKYVDDQVSGLRNEINSLDLGFAKVGDFATRKNDTTLPIDVTNGGELDIRGTNGNTLFYVGKDDHNNDVIKAGSRIQYVNDPIYSNDAATKKYVDEKTGVAEKYYSGMEYYVAFSTDGIDHAIWTRVVKKNIPNWISLPYGTEKKQYPLIKIKIENNAPDLDLEFFICYNHCINSYNNQAVITKTLTSEYKIKMIADYNERPLPPIEYQVSIGRLVDPSFTFQNTLDLKGKDLDLRPLYPGEILTGGYNNDPKTELLNLISSSGWGILRIRIA